MSGRSGRGRGWGPSRGGARRPYLQSPHKLKKKKEGLFHQLFGIGLWVRATHASGSPVAPHVDCWRERPWYGHGDA